MNDGDVSCLCWQCLVLGNTPPYQTRVLYYGGTLDYSFIWTIPHISLLHDITGLLCCTYRAELARGTTTCSVVVCVCVVNLMIVCKAPSRLFCGTSTPYVATAKHEIMGRVQISHDDGKEQLWAVYAVQLQEQQHAGRSASVLADAPRKFVHLLLFRSEKSCK